jgi:hypothetical protein
MILIENIFEKLKVIKEIITIESIIFNFYFTIYIYMTYKKMRH